MKKYIIIEGVPHLASLKNYLNIDNNKIFGGDSPPFTVKRTSKFWKNCQK